MAKPTTALVTAPTFINGVLHMPGEIASVYLDDLGVDSLDDETMQGLTKAPADGEQIAYVPIAAVAPHAPNPTAPQGLPPGTVMTGTGRYMAPADDADAGLAREIKADSADVQEGATKKK